ncbi:hypothetical protein ACFO5R_01080 [Halosolutus amylolyticus]|uniref:2,4-diaminopentanoate dehydrogenase C-terminal domain-containing protein n=2 Tax=Halosolutus amylolyticus TaxID=2932267 RepID=A0ABD5PIW6_9EURY|nr:hypothetical protein [Halosolutus amylolyticus]
MASGANVVSTTEELTYPHWSNPGVAKELDAAARENGVTCLGAGINPGFVMDAFPVVCSTPMAEVESVHVKRIQDASVRRGPLQEKVGAGIDVETFKTEIATGAGHVGSTESVAMLADALGWELDSIDEEIEPVIADEHIETDHVVAEEGDVAGVRQIAYGQVDDEDVVTLDLQMYVGADEPRDVVDFEGDPDVTITVDGGFHGDVSTSAVVTNVAPRVHEADAGLATMADVAMPSFVRN